MKQVLDKLTFKHMKLNKKRTLVTIIGIMLATILITGIVVLVFSFQNFMIETEIESGGNYHITFQNLNEENYKYIDKDPYFTEDRMLSKEVLDINDPETEQWLYSLVAYNDKAYENLSFTLDEGRLPESKNEIVLSNRYIKVTNKDLKIGNKITIKEKEYEIVGTWDSSPLLTYMEKGDYEFVDLYLLAKNPKDIYEHGDEIQEDLNLDINDVQYNNFLLSYMGISGDDSFNSFLYTIGAVLLVIVIAGTSSLISTSFSISISERKKEIGMLKSIGATPKQIRHSILKEGLFLFIITVPLSLCLTYIIALILANVVNSLLIPLFDVAELNSRLEVIVNLKILLISVAFILLNVLVAVILPSIKASKTNPIKVIKQTDDIKLTKRKLKVSKLTKKIYGISGMLAKKSIKRNKKRFIITNIALTISVVVLIVFSSFMQFTFKTADLQFKYNNFNVVSGTQITIDETDEFLRTIENNTKDNYSYSSNAAVFVEDKDLIIKKIKNEFAEEDEIVANVYVYALSSNNYKEYLDRLGIELDKNEGILIDKTLMRVDNKSTETNIFDKNKILGKTLGDSNIIIKTVTDEVPDAYTSNIGMSAALIVNEETMDELTKEFWKDSKLISFVTYINSSDPDKLEENLNKQQEFDMEAYNYNKTNQVLISLVKVIGIFLYSFITLVTLISVANIFNVITSNIELKRREYVNIKAIGGSEKTIKTIIIFESLLYIVNSLIYGIIIGVLGSYLLYKGYNNMIDFNYMIPRIPIALTIIGMFAIVLSTSTYMNKKILSSNLIDTIKDENI